MAASKVRQARAAANAGLIRDSANLVRGALDLVDDLPDPGDARQRLEAVLHLLARDIATARVELASIAQDLEAR